MVEPEVARVSAKEKGQEQPVEFALTNRGRKPITIRGVSSNCGCVAVGAYEGTVLAPGETLALRFLVRVPEYGVSRTRLEVIHDRDSTPVEMYVEAAGSQALPVVREIRNGSPTFLALRPGQDDERITIRTYEPLGSGPWITEMTSELDAVSVELVDRHDEDRPEAGLIERVYTYRVSWKRLPATTEFSGKLWAVPSVAGATPIRVGTISGRLASRRPFSPSMARLVPGEHPREIVLFDTDAGTWAIPHGVRLPDWLEAEWLAGGAAQRLALKLRDSTKVRGGTFELPLEDGQGSRQMLRVVLTEPVRR